MAFRAAALRQVGPFDERLGPGTAGHEEETEICDERAFGRSVQARDFALLSVTKSAESASHLAASENVC